MAASMAGLQRKLLQAALAYPGAKEDHPWGETVVKVGKKIFIFLGMAERGSMSLSVKLPQSGSMALSLPFCKPTGYGLGKAGWVSARLTAKDTVPLPVLLEWLRESYLAIAPKKLAAKLGDGE